MAEGLRADRARGASLEFGRFVLAGAINTAVGYALFVALVWWAGWSPQTANAAGYAAGVGVSLLLNRFFVFRGARLGAGTVSRFLAGFAAAYPLNLAALTWLLQAGWPPAIAQLVAMITYTITFYAINRLWVWRDRTVAGE